MKFLKNFMVGVSALALSAGAAQAEISDGVVKIGVCSRWKPSRLGPWHSAG